MGKREGVKEVFTKKNFNKLAGFSVILILAISILAINFSLAGQETPPIINISLARTNFMPNEAIVGEFQIIFNSSFSADTPLNLKLDNSLFQLKISEALDKINASYKKTAGSLIGTNPATQKVLTITADSPKRIGIVIPKEVQEIQTIEFAISGQSYNNNYLKFPYIDFLEDESNEWRYLGSFVGWGEEVNPDGLKGTLDTTMNGITKNTTGYCQLINLPYANRFNISAKYKKLTANDDIKAVLLRITSLSGQDAEALVDVGCDLPEPAVNSPASWNSCEIQTEYAINGNNLICVYSQFADEVAGVSTFELVADKLTPKSAYTCDEIQSPLASQLSCVASARDYFIKVNPANYTGTFSSTTTLTANLQTSLTFLKEKIAGADGYLASCQTFDGENCLVTFKVGGQGEGKIVLSSLSLNYVFAEAPESTDKFYEANTTPPTIYELGFVDLSNASSLAILPLTIFSNLTSPANFSGDSKVSLLEAWIGNSNKSSVPIITYKNATPTELGEVEQKLQETKSALNNIISGQDANIQKIVEISKLGTEINDDLAALSTLESRLGALKISSAPRNEQTQELTSIKKEVDNLTSAAIKSAKFIKSFTDTLSIEPNQIISEIVPEGYESKEVYFMQQKIQVTTELKKFSIKRGNSEELNGHLVKKTIKALENLKDVDVYEIIEKNAAPSTDDLIFEEGEAPITVKDDPILKWKLPSLSSGSEKTYYYIIDNNLDVDVNDLKTIIFTPEEGEEQPPEEKKVECGDRVCTTPLEDKFSCPQDCKPKRPWWLIISIIAVVIIIAFYLNLYRGPGNFRELTRGKNPFKNDADLKAVTDYIKSSKEKGAADDKITEALLKSGWSEKQAQFAFEELAWHKQLTKITSSPPQKQAELKTMKEYIEKAIQKGMKKEEITSNLTKAGWNARQVKNAYLK
ncbi:hypothetical protein HY643_00785, partial [Candidatus Woesearchaeota archaeon]|nr:hypothetical protein [Candidatus Woesearchaeota archaeon]